jgi:hypothetical protein
VLVLKIPITKLVRFDPVNPGLEALTVLTGLVLTSGVSKIETSDALPEVVFTDNPVMVVSDCDTSLATIVVSVTLPLAMFGAENIPVPVMFAKVTLLVVAMLCGRLSVTAPVLALAVTWLAVPVIELTGVTHWVA